ncbi:MAG: energy transducer TonB [Hyphomonadaceae bacterium]|nr:energy transducer TonB [Hyphomonadaceae bacterium]
MAVRERAAPLSIGEQAITVEIVIGGDVAAGLAATPSEAEAAQSATETAEREEIERPQHAAERAPVAPDPPREDAPVPVAEAPQPVEEPAPVVAVAVPEKTDAPVERAPEVAPQAKPEKKPEKKSDKKSARTAAVSAPASSGVGRGRSDADVNYQGRIVAHLARHKRYPADARSRRDEGSAMVRFSIDGGGQVTAVAVTKASGFAALDRETEAMVRRASPFPAPPDGRPRTFSAPVSFRLE